MLERSATTPSSCAPGRRAVCLQREFVGLQDAQHALAVDRRLPVGLRSRLSRAGAGDSRRLGARRRGGGQRQELGVAGLAIGPTRLGAAAHPLGEVGTGDAQRVGHGLHRRIVLVP